MKIYTLIIAFCLLPALVSAEAIKSPSSSFISIFSCDESNPRVEEGDVCLIGEFREGESVYLLAEDIVCKAKTGESEMLEREVGAEFMITPVELGNCDPADYFLAWRGKKPASFRPLSLIQETSVEKRSKVDATIRKGYLTEEIAAAFEGTLEAAPILYKPFPKRPDLFLVQYITAQPLQEGDLYGPLFWYAQGRVELVDAQASIAAFFSLQNEKFLLLRHDCWQGCGELSEKLLNVSEKGFTVIHQDASFSD